jgi:uncharacterized protein (DUF2141 family)
MKHFLIIILIILCPFALLATDAPKTLSKADGGKGNLIINITGFESNNGVASIGITDSKENYDNGNNFRGVHAPIQERIAQFIAEDIEFGDYAVKVYHDENNNSKMDKAMFGIPTEAYGFSNDARGKFGPPKYSEAVFQFNSSGQEIFIKIK